MILVKKYFEIQTTNLVFCGEEVKHILQKKQKNMFSYRSTVLSIVLALFCIACKNNVLPRQGQAQYAAFAPADADPLHFSFDWRMGVTDSLRSGSALFFRCSVPRSAGRIATVHLVDKYNSQYGIKMERIAIEGEEHTLLLFAFTPEETAKLPAGQYFMAAEVRTENGEHFTSALLSFSLLAPDTPLGERAQTNERRRFAALLLLQGDEESFTAVAKSVLPPQGQEDVISHVLALSRQSAVRVGSSASPVAALNDYAHASHLSPRERALAVLALNEAQLRTEADAKSGK